MTRMPSMGMPRPRKGRPPISLQTLIDRARQKKADVSVDDAEQAATVLQRSKGRGARMRDYTLAGSVGKPLVSIMGSMTEHGAKGLQKGPNGVRTGLVKGIGAGFRNAATGPKITRQAVEGGVGGSILAGTREALEARRAKRKAMEFLATDGMKSAAQQKLSAGLDRSLPALASKVRPVRTPRLNPIMDGDYDFEV
jgi:hypothetical protein